jgi:hypothetical protein
MAEAEAAVRFLGPNGARPLLQRGTVVLVSPRPVGCRRAFCRGQRPGVRSASYTTELDRGQHGIVVPHSTRLVRTTTNPPPREASDASPSGGQQVRRSSSPNDAAADDGRRRMLVLNPACRIGASLRNLEYLHRRQRDDFFGRSEYDFGAPDLRNCHERINQRAGRVGFRFSTSGPEKIGRDIQYSVVLPNGVERADLDHPSSQHRGSSCLLLPSRFSHREEGQQLNCSSRNRERRTGRRRSQAQTDNR